MMMTVHFDIPTNRRLQYSVSQKTALLQLISHNLTIHKNFH